MKKVIAYCRVSTDGQAGEDKFGLDAQKEQISEYCKRNDLEIIEWFVDEGISGAYEGRPAFDKIVYGEENNPEYEAVVVAKSDRVARDIQLYFYYSMLLKKKGVELISAIEDFGAFGAFSNILKSFTLFVAEQERTNITRRTSGGRKIKAQRGGYAGGRAPFGYRVSNGALEIYEPEAQTVREIFEYSKRGLNMLQISNKLNEKGLKTRLGKQFYASNIKIILENEKTYRGFYRYGDSGWVKGQQEAILK